MNMHQPEELFASEACRAVVVDDDVLARRTINDVLRRAGVIVVAEAADGGEAVELVRHHEPDLVLMDIVMPGLDGIAATRHIIEERPDQLIILLTSAGSDDLAVLGLRVGATGYLSKDVDLEALPRAIAGALHGEAAISRTMTATLIKQFRRVPMPGNGLRPVHSPLTTREWEVLDLICDGMTTDEIAARFVVSRDGALTREAHPAQARRQLATGGGRRGAPNARPRPLTGPSTRPNSLEAGPSRKVDALGGAPCIRARCSLAA
jgi:NarL family two-component system response regulator LiaR